MGCRFRGTSDTEVLLEGVRIWGLEATVRRLVGMFAFALWEHLDRRLWLVRDRLGVKPLYYGWVEGRFVFASELHAIETLPGFRGTVDEDAVVLYTLRSYVPAPWSIWRDIRKLPPGTILEVSAKIAPGTWPTPAPYWSLADVVTEAMETPFRGAFHDAVETLECLLVDCVGLRMVADVPVGVFLSGGIDSSLVAALAQRQSARPVRTYTVGFEYGAIDEAPYAAAVARHLGTEHHEMRVTADDALDVIPRLSQIYDEPFADSSQIPTHLISRHARESVKVALSGDGGDELFCGYKRYFRADGLLAALSHSRSDSVPPSSVTPGPSRAPRPSSPACPRRRRGRRGTGDHVA